MIDKSNYIYFLFLFYNLNYRVKIEVSIMPGMSIEYCKSTPITKMGFSQRSSCKALGILPRTSGKKIVSNKYKSILRSRSRSRLKSRSRSKRRSKRIK